MDQYLQIIVKILIIELQQLTENKINIFMTIMYIKPNFNNYKGKMQQSNFNRLRSQLMSLPIEKKIICSIVKKLLK